MIQTLAKDNYQIVENEYAGAGAKIQVMIVDMHMLMREALYRVVSTFPHIHICASLGSLEEATLVVQKMQPQVVILGSSISVSACLDLIKFISEGQSSVGIVVIQRCLSPVTTMTFLKQRMVQSLLGEEASEADLAKAITAAATGNTFLDRGAREILDFSVSRAPVHFTRREVEVLSLLKCGESNFGIARALGMREKTVEKHLTRIYEKLNINSRAEAILQIQSLHI